MKKDEFCIQIQFSKDLMLSKYFRIENQNQVRNLRIMITTKMITKWVETRHFLLQHQRQVDDKGSVWNLQMIKYYA